MRETYIDDERFTIVKETGTNEVGKRFVFLHLEVHQWTPKVWKDLKEMFNKGLKELEDEGWDMVSFYVPIDHDIKFHNKLKPLDYQRPFGDQGQYLIGGWYLGE